MVSLMVLGGAQMFLLRKKTALIKKREARRITRHFEQTSPLLLISEHLSPERICFFNGKNVPARIFSELISRIPVKNPALSLGAILDREGIGSTTAAPGIALPHARLPYTGPLSAALGICPEGVETRAGEPRVYVFLLFISDSGDLKNHLRFLAGASALFQRENFAAELTGLKNPQTVLDKIRQAERDRHA